MCSGKVDTAKSVPQPHECRVLNDAVFDMPDLINEKAGQKPVRDCRFEVLDLAWKMPGKGGAEQAAAKLPTADNHLSAQGASPPEPGGELFKGSPPQMRRGGALSAGVVLTRG